jgi:hypothetical protein
LAALSLDGTKPLLFQPPLSLANLEARLNEKMATKTSPISNKNTSMRVIPHKNNKSIIAYFGLFVII